MSEYVAPEWIDPIWTDAQAACNGVGNDVWRRAMISSSSFPDMAEAVRYLRAWRDALGTRHGNVVRAGLTVWWWERTGETRHPWPAEVEAEAGRAA